MEVEKHCALLQSMCRLCGSKKSRRFFPKHRLCAIIQRALSIDISNDEESVHPPVVCERCLAKLERFRKKSNRRIKVTHTIVLHQFEQHGENCSICSSDGDTGESWFCHVGNEAQMRGFLAKVCKDGGNTVILSIDEEGNTRWCLLVSTDGDWSVKVYGRKVNSDVFDNVPSQISSRTHIIAILDQLQSLHVCPGNPEYFFPENVLRSRPVYLHHSSSTTTIRHSSCPLLTKEMTRCLPCRIYRSDLAKLHHRYQVESSPAPKTNFRYLSKERLSKKLERKKMEGKSLKKKVSRLEKKIAKMFEKTAIIITEEQSNSFSSILQREADNVTDYFEEGSRMSLLWNEQEKALQRHKKGMRWHPAILRLCIALHSKSAGAYDLLRKSGFLSLPHKNTLKEYTGFAANNPGFNPSVIKRIFTDIGIDSLKDHEKNVAVSFDEMKISEGLVYSHSSGDVIGFTSLGTFNDELDRYKQRCTSKQQGMASHVLTVMIRAICSSYKAAIAYFATSGASSDQLYNIIVRTVEILELWGLKVRALVCDGAAPNRGAYELLSFLSEDNFYFTSPFTGNRIYLFSDTPHLIKTTRNNLENSGYHNKSRNMMFRGLSITWKHIIGVYEWDQHSSGLRMLHRVSLEHLHPTPAQRMKVKLAAQILSSSVANALRVQGKSETSSTALFLDYMDQFFDCLNVAHLDTGKRKRKPALEPYRDSSDWRFVWLEEDFLGFLEEWETEGNVTGLPASQRDKLCLSRQTLDGLKMTVKSFVSLTREMLNEPGVDFILSEKFSQDPLEEYFSKQRGMGGSHDNPTVLQFGSNMTTLHVAGGAVRASKRANVHVAGTSAICDDPIPRKRLFKDKK